MDSSAKLAPADDLLQGAEAIAAFVGEPRRRTIYLLEKGLLPAGKLGTRWVASKQRLTEFYARLTVGQAA
ncbi:MAG TPA: hypothetical protein VHL31_03190 [Geminicoccus sp.]|jgi:hypothetical protein|uniref:hypothetical protein n=1 Tax=Geminicoccus sp. TaxID=2024832 RepID=UPI002E35241B|nr:hypothetical protein [Geminicoccus sp.]HEX2525291.1 hypothetical protein [Geminicoccus sp.]